MPFEKINSLDVYYETHGEEAETIVLMHHGFGSLTMWKDVCPRLAAQGFKVVAYDRRGYGRSEEGDGFRTFYESEDRYRKESTEEFRQLRQALGIGRCHIVGQCEGGVIAIDYAVAYPEDVLTLTVASTQCYSEISNAEAGVQKLVRRFSLLEPRLQMKMIEWHGERAEVRYDQFAKFGGAYGSISKFDLRPLLPKVLCRALVIYPDRSALFDVEQGVAFYRHLPKGELAVFPRCGHNTYDQRSEEYAKAVVDFIARSSTAPGRQEGQSPAMTCLA
jgi:pimeloyl-ACP methyl ester carboxylesterase